MPRFSATCRAWRTFIHVFTLVGIILSSVWIPAAHPLTAAPAVDFQASVVDSLPQVTPPTQFIPQVARNQATSSQAMLVPSAEARQVVAQGLPLVFVKNVGQSDSDIQYQIQSPQTVLSFTPQAALLSFTLPSTHTISLQAQSQQRFKQEQTKSNPTFTTKLTYVGANTSSAIVHGTALSSTMSFIDSSTAAGWERNVATYQDITYQQLYSGVDLQYTLVDSQLKSTYTVAPGADATQIRWDYSDASQVSVDSTGNLVTIFTPTAMGITTPITITEQAPSAWQDIGGQRQMIPVEYTVGSTTQVSFKLGVYDTRYPLVIDPTIEFGTYLGGNDADRLYDIGLDDDGYIYVVGNTLSGDFPGTAQNGQGGFSWSIFVSKLSPDGSSLINTTLIDGSSVNYIVSLNSSYISDNGYVYLTGVTTSPNFPIYNAYDSSLGQDSAVFITKLDNNGNIVFSTYLSADVLSGQLDHASNDIGIDITSDALGNAYVLISSDDPYFPVTDTSNNSCFGLFSCESSIIAKISSSGQNVLYSTTVFANKGPVDPSGIKLDNKNHIILTGNLYNANYDPYILTTTVGAYRSCDQSVGQDTFFSIISIDAKQVISRTCFGAYLNIYSQGSSVVLDTDGNAYLAGWVNGATIPCIQGLQCTFGGGDQDGFIVKLTPNAQLVYSSYFGGSNDDAIFDLDIDKENHITIGGWTTSDDIFRGDNIFPDQITSPHDGIQLGFVATLTAQLDALRFGAYIGENAGVSALEVDDQGDIYIAGITGDRFPVTSDTYQPIYGGGTQDTFIAKISSPVLLPDEQRCHCGLTQPSTDSPVNTRTGNYWTSVTDVVAGRPGIELDWTRVYASQAITDTFGDISPGWQYPYATHLITPTTEANTAIIVTAENNRQRFYHRSDGTYRPRPGVTSTLTESNGVFTQTLPDQQQLRFRASDGRLIEMRDVQGRALKITWDGTHLQSVFDPADTTRLLEITYDGDHITGVANISGQTVQYTYTADGDLETVTDMMGRVTRYTYQNHVLTTIERVQGNTTQLVEHIDYDVLSSAGKVIHQDLEDGRHIDFTYLSASTIITTTAQGEVSVAQVDYASNNTMVGMRTNGQTTMRTLADGAFQPGYISDGNGNATRTIYTRQGLPTKQTNALGQVTTAQFNAANQVTLTTNNHGVSTRYEYDSHQNLIKMTTGITTTAPVQQTTLYTYTYNMPFPGESQLQATQGPDGIVTTYIYGNDLASRRLVQRVIVSNGSQKQITEYRYDMAGNRTEVITGVGTAFERIDFTFYNWDNTVSRVVQNYINGVFDPAKPDEDLSTTYGYDLRGRQVWVKDPAGHVNATHYNSQGRIDWSIQNIVPFVLDSDNQPIFQPFSPTHPDQNVATLTGYDGLGRTSLLTQTGILTGTFNPQTLTFSAATTRVTKTEYDSLSRPITTTLNYRPNLPTSADTNVQTLTYYDAAGNVTWQRDALGRWSHIEYDVLSRPITTTLNYENGNPLTVDVANRSWTNGSDTDMVQVIHYTMSGEADYSIENYVDGIFTTTEPITDRVTLYRYDALDRNIETIQNYDPTQATENDTNRITVTAYDPATGRVIGTQDGLGRWLSQQYDALGRTVSQTQNCRTTTGMAVSNNCAPFSSVRPDRNIATQTIYDDLGRISDTVDPLGIFSHTVYDKLGRSITKIQNYVPGATADNETNITSFTRYNELGQTTVVTDALGAVMRMAYDGLGQTSVITDSLGHVTRQGGDGTGAQRWSKAADGVVSITQVDGLGRVVTTIANYQDGVVAANEPADTDLIARTVYDRAGRVLQEIDAAGVVKAYTYDLNDRLVAVTENVASSTCAHAPCNVVTRYAYDRAGNHTKVTDARSIVTRTMAYNAANELVSQRDGLGIETRYIYDRGGRQVGKVDPRGSDYSLIYAYDERDRQTGIAAGNSAKLSPISIAYDARGTRTSMTDGTGTTSFVPDALGRITEVTAPSGTVSYGYTALGQRRELTYPDGTKVTYTYTSGGQLYQVLNGSATLATYGYDATGRTKTFSRANGVTTSYDYDSAGRLKQIATASTAQGTLAQFGYTLDRTGKRTFVSEQLGATAVSTGSQVLTYMTDSYPQSLAVQDMNDDTARDRVQGDGILDAMAGSEGDSGNMGSSHVAAQTARNEKGSTTYKIGLKSIPTPTLLPCDPDYPGCNSRATATRTNTPQPTATRTNTPQPTATRTNTPQPTATRTNTPQPTATRTNTPQPTATRTNTPQPTATRTNTPQPTTVPPLPAQTRTITYTYDGLGRLTGADASTSADYTYSYDLVGNRTDGGKTYNAANQLVGASYDLAGNMTGDGTTTYTYDALNRLVVQGETSFEYNADGILVKEATSGVMSFFVQDLMAPLSQVLRRGSTDYIYGADRIAALGGTGYTWYATDALGSVRGTLDAAGDIHAPISYDPWGQVESGTVPTFGFTGEMQQGSQVYLRARWYDATKGAFLGADSWKGDLKAPDTLHGTSYTANDPINRTDPSGYDWRSSFNWDIVRKNAASIIAEAKKHARPTDGFGWETTAALMATHIARESREGFWIGLYNWGGDQVGKLRNNNPSTGIANIRPQVVQEIINGDLVLENHREGSAKYTLCRRASSSYTFDGSDSYANYGQIYEYLQDDENTIEVLAVNLERGIDRAKLMPIIPSIYNMGNWLWMGSQEPWKAWKGIVEFHGDTNVPFGMSGGVAMAKTINSGATALGISITGVNYYNKDEAPFVECYPVRSGGGFLVEPSCAYPGANNGYMSAQDFISNFGATIKKLNTPSTPINLNIRVSTRFGYRDLPVE